MTYRPLPIDPVGYAVDPKTGEVHTRWASHAVGLPRTRQATGVWAILGREPVPCRECYGPAVPVRHLNADDLELLPPEPEPTHTRRSRRRAIVDEAGS